MVKEARGFGATIDEAKEKAIAELKASDFDDIQFEVITMPKKKVLGLFGGCNAEVRAYVEVEDKKVKPNKNKKENNSKKEAVKKAENTAKKAEAPAKKQEEKKVEPEKQETAKPAAIKELPEYGEPVDESQIEADSPAAKAIAYIRTVLANLNCGEINIKVASRENASRILLDGEDLSIIIGRRGETLDSLQYLAGLAANNGGGHYKISLNIGNYREKREETLVNLANRISAQVLKTGKSRTLEPMNPYERRIIHTAIQSIDGVVSNSFGEGTARRVVISVEGAQVRPPRLNDHRRSNSHRSGSRRPAPAKNTVEAPVREPKRDSDMPLYGKIN